MATAQVEPTSQSAIDREVGSLAIGRPRLGQRDRWRTCSYRRFAPGRSHQPCGGCRGTPSPSTLQECYGKTKTGVKAVSGGAETGYNQMLYAVLIRSRSITRRHPLPSPPGGRPAFQTTHTGIVAVLRVSSSLPVTAPGPSTDGNRILLGKSGFAGISGRCLPPAQGDHVRIAFMAMQRCHRFCHICAQK